MILHVNSIKVEIHFPKVGHRRTAGSKLISREKMNPVNPFQTLLFSHHRNMLHVKLYPRIAYPSPPYILDTVTSERNQQVYYERGEQKVHYPALVIAPTKSQYISLSLY